MGSCFRRNDSVVFACDKREAFAQGSTCDEAIHLRSGDTAPRRSSSLPRLRGEGRPQRSGGRGGGDV